MLRVFGFGPSIYAFGYEGFGFGSPEIGSMDVRMLCGHAGKSWRPQKVG